MEIPKFLTRSTVLTLLSAGLVFGLVPSAEAERLSRSRDNVSRVDDHHSVSQIRKGSSHDWPSTVGNGNDNGGNDNGGNGNGGNDNGGNDNGGNDNGGNDNGGNGNGGDVCPDGSFEIDGDLFDGGDEVGDAEYRESAGGCVRFRVRVEDFAAGSYEVVAADTVVGFINVGSDGRGELEYDTEDGTFPDMFPVLMIGDVVEVGGFASATLVLDCSPDPDSCNGNGNGNDNGGNDNGGNDNGGNDNGGNDNGGNDNGGNGNGGNDNGGNDNGGNDNGGNDNGGNDNGGNDNGGNDNGGNDNGDGHCIEYVVRAESELAAADGPENGEAEYRLKYDGRERFELDVRDFTPGTYDVAINDVVVAQIFVEGSGKGEIEFRSQDGNFPAGFPEIQPGDVIDVGLIAFGEFDDECIGDMQNDNSGNDNGGNDNGGNDNGGNDNGMDNTNGDDEANANADER